MPRRSAGILIYRGAGAEVEVLIAHPGGPFWAKRDLGAWSIPKGECEEGEEPLECALRELREELGEAAPRPCEPIALGSVRQKGGKVVHAWGAEGDFDPAALAGNKFALEWPPRSGARREFPEVDRVEWFSPPTAREKLLEAQVAFVDRLLRALAGRGE